MKCKPLFTVLLIFSLNELSAQACITGDPSSINYIRRDNNRCEGVDIQKNIPINGRGFNLISFATRKIDNDRFSVNSVLTLMIPRISNSNPPKVRLRSSVNPNYRLDEVSFPLNIFNLTFSTYVLNKLAITPKSLRALAEVNVNSEWAYLPVTIGQSSNKYEFVFFTSNWVDIPIFKIFYNNALVYNPPGRMHQQAGEIIFNWDTRNAPAAGRYVLQIEANLERTGGSPDRIKSEFIFYHDPRWLSQ